METSRGIWGSIFTDFIVQLPRIGRGFEAITTWVDRISRRFHFLPSRTEDTAVNSSKYFFNNLFKLHGLPDDIASDLYPKITS